MHTSREVKWVVGSKSRESINWTKTGAAGGVYWAPQSRAKKKKKMHNDIINILVKSDGEDD